MNTSTNAPDLIERVFHDTEVGNYWHSSPAIVHVGIILALAFGVHLIVKIIHKTSEW
jgi:hypothetical protein